MSKNVVGTQHIKPSLNYIFLKIPIHSISAFSNNLNYDLWFINTN